MEASHSPSPDFAQDPGDLDELESILPLEVVGSDEQVLAEPGDAETDNVVELPVDPDAILRSVLEYLGFRGDKLEFKIDDLKKDPETRRKLLIAYQDEALARREG